MIIRDQGIVVGKLDDQSLALSSVTSDKLKALINDWRKQGLELTAAAEGSLEKGEASADASIHVSFTTENLFIFENQLLIEGFDVQTA